MTLEPLHPLESVPTISVRDLRVTRGDSTAVEIDALDIAVGVTTLIGPNGSGKSTLLHAIAGLLPIASGRIDINAPRGTRPHPVAYVLQAQPSAAHLLVTAREVVELGRSVDRGAFRRLNRNDHRLVDRAMERLDIANLARRHLADLSGGQRQRVFIAQGLAQDADILLLDEPTAGLDLASMQAIRDIVQDERAVGRTVVVATHDLGEAGTADRVILVNRSVVSAGAPSEVLTTANLRIAYSGRVLELGDQLVAVDDGVHHDSHEHDHHVGRSGHDEHGRHHDHDHEH
jgi:ABC-type Mn2+/Zn2+ transport system ATPase subunit